ncbi:hypothetical protein JIN85_14740 [Luteolibacter pohnpeiensis]|uniref:Uncharacterized protein n=1 Tax=Luteolibacter pohnpeiensis TaxID=454153 RepID=A0A934VXC1_9BACT|nr:hypothetical protein [Luteolibacter pohnpeiensis]MBK1883673.1 hypothetical protein [Luteolibacter pohnpeiensis]
MNTKPLPAESSSYDNSDFVPQSPVAKNLSRLGVEFDSLRDAINNLEHRLAPVLGPDLKDHFEVKTPKIEVNSTSVSDECELERDLDSLASRFAAMQERVTGLLSRVRV